MLTVWSVCNGSKYGTDDVLCLQAQVRRHLQAPHRFRCLSDRQIPGVDCLVAPERWPGWWAKLSLFRHARDGRHLYLDLDCVVVGALDWLLSDRLSMPANWAQSGHGGCQSSVMSWGLDYGFLADEFDPAELHKPDNGNCGSYGPRRLWGDQEFITELFGPPGDGVVEPMRGVYSYKYHCRETGRPPADARVVTFHGEPKAPDCSESWIRNARSFTATSR